MIAGRDTTAGTLSWFLYVLCRDQRIQDKIAKEVREATKMAPEGNASAAENMGGTTPMETDDGGPKQSGPEPNTTSETHRAPESSEQPPLKEGEHRLHRRPPRIRKRQII